MKLDDICKGLKELLVRTNYKDCTIETYEREWAKIGSYLQHEHCTDVFTMELGLKYLESQYGIVTKYKDGSLNQQRVQLIRVVHMLEDFQLHGVLVNRYIAGRNKIKLNCDYENLRCNFISFMYSYDLSKSTINHYSNTCLVFLDYLQQKSFLCVPELNLVICHDFIKTFSWYSFKAIEQRLCGLRYFLRYLQTEKYIDSNIADKLHMAPVSKTAKIPSSFTKEELSRMISTIDRNSPIGKRNYAMILLACILGIRSGDIKRMCFNNFDWEAKQISFIQHKTKKAITLPLPDAVGWAVIDYIKNGRPKYFDSSIIFLKHMPPYEPFPCESSLSEIMKKHLNKAGVRIKNRRTGFHSLRHSAASIMLESNIQLPVISTILGHSDLDVTSIYLKTDIEKLKECVLSLDFESEVQINVL